MSILKCKYCGGAVSPFPVNNLGVCSCCGSTVTLPSGEDPRRLAGHNAGSYFRRMGNFDKALSIYQQLLKQDPSDAEAYWGSALSRFGIVYEEDPEVGEYVPACHAPIPGSFLQDEDYLAALAYSGSAVRQQYEQEAARIEALLALPEEKPDPAAEAPQQPSSPLEDEHPPIAEEEPPALILKKAFWNLEMENWEDAEQFALRGIRADETNPLSYLAGLMAQLHCRKPTDLMECSTSFEELENFRKAMQYADPKLKQTLIQCSEQANKRFQLTKINEFYSAAVSQMKNASTPEDYQKAAQQFARLSHFQDSDQRRKECLQQGETLRKDAIYNNAMALARSAKTKAQWEEIISLFSSISGWKDADEKAANCRKQYKQAEASQGVRASIIRGIRITAGLTAAALILGIGSYLFITKYYIPQSKYDAAERYLSINDKENAIIAFQELGDYKDSQDRAVQIQEDWYAEAEALLTASDNRRAAIAFGGLRDYSDARERSRTLWADIVSLPTICAGGWYTAGLRSDGMAFAVGDNRDSQTDVGGWLNIRAISAGWSHTVGLRSDGTVVAAGYNGDGRSDVDSWRDVVAISAGQWHTVGLKTDGRLLATGCSRDGRTDFQNWRDIIAVSAGRNHTLGLRADNTVVATGRNESGQCDVGDWYAIRAIAAGGEHSVGLKMDGTVVAAGSNYDGQCQIANWSNITAIAAGYYHTVGLKDDGTVVAVGLDWDMQCEVKKWTDIVAIAAGGWHTVGLKSDGTVVCVGRNENGQCETSEWANMMLPVK